MNCQDAKDRLNDYMDGTLAAKERENVATHVRMCPACRRELERMQAIAARVQALPRDIQPSKDLWPAISDRIGPSERSRTSQLTNTGVHGPIPLNRARIKQPLTWSSKFAIAAVITCVAAGSIWFATQTSRTTWEVAALEGMPVVGSDRVNASARLKVGDWLETDAASRAKLDVGMIGEVEVEPNTRLRLLQSAATDHRIALARGTIHATIWAPPRLFFVETPSAIAVDLGCAYTLQVADDGASLLHVTTGWVALELAGRESIIPAGAVCETRPGIGPGTPYYEDAPEALTRSLREFDFGTGGSDILDAILQQTRERDALTLWHLLTRVEDSERGRVYDRLAGLAPPPGGVTRDGILRGDKTMLDQWSDELGFGEFF